MEDFLDPTDIYCRLKPRAQRRPTAESLRREYCQFRRTRFGAFAECYVAAALIFAAAVAAWRAFA